VFAGGGCRCFWQAGFWTSAAEPLGIVPEVVAGVSAGAALACAALTGASESVLADFKRRTAANPRNIYPRNLLYGDPLFPHEAIYRETIAEHMDEPRLKKLQSGPEVRVLLARPHEWLGPRSAYSLAVVAHALNRRELRVHARWGQRFGFEPEAVSVRSCRTPADLVSLILHTSCAPPLVPMYRRDERIVLDGGLLDNAPADLIDTARSTLVLLTRRHPPAGLPKHPARLYVQPSDPIPIAEWDYTSPSGIQRTYDLGRRDGDAFVREWSSAGAAADAWAQKRIGTFA